MVYMMTARELLRLLKKRGCLELRQSGSHITVKCGHCLTTVSVHKGEDIRIGTLMKIERELEECLGKDWLKNSRRG